LHKKKLYEGDERHFRDSFLSYNGKSRQGGEEPPQGLIRKRLDWFDSKANNATSLCRQTPFGTAKAAARLNLNSLFPLSTPLPTSKLICEGRVDRANRNSTVQISYPRFPRAQRPAKRVSDRRLLRARGMSLQRDENIFENSHLGDVPSRPRSRGEKSRNFRVCDLRRAIFSPRRVDIGVPSQ